MAGDAAPPSIYRAPAAVGTFDLPTLLIVIAGIAALYAPMLGDWIRGALFEERHELLIVGVAAFLLFRRRAAVAALPASHRTAGGWILLGIALLAYLFSRLVGTQAILVLSFILTVTASLWVMRGRAAVRASAFPLAFLLFAYPLPHEFVLWLTGPLKEAVSAVATQLLSALGYPAGHSGVVITIGQYQLLVVEACAGLQTMFTLEAMGLLYANLANHPTVGRSAAIAVLVVPISFAANVVRVVCLALVTYYFGDAAGQGFLHGFAGILLFLVALIMITSVDGLLGRFWPGPRQP